MNERQEMPIGNLTSQLWANVYLNPLDHFIKRCLGCAAYVRYVDDLLLFANKKSVLWDWKERLEQRLEKFCLRFHDGFHPRPVTEGFGFLGFRIFPNRRCLKKRKGTQYQKHLKQLLLNYEQGILPADSLLDSILAWNNHLSYGNTMGLRRAVFSTLPLEIAQLARRRYRKTLVRRETQKK